MSIVYMMHVGIDVVLKCNLAQAISFLNKVEVYTVPGDSNCRILFKKKHSEEFVREKPYSLVKTLHSSYKFVLFCKFCSPGSQKQIL